MDIVYIVASLCLFIFLPIVIGSVLGKYFHCLSCSIVGVIVYASSCCGIIVLFRKSAGVLMGNLPFASDIGKASAFLLMICIISYYAYHLGAWSAKRAREKGAGGRGVLS